MKNKLKMFVALLAVAALTLSGCGSAASSAPAEKSQPAGETSAAASAQSTAGGEEVSFTFWGGWTGPDADTMKAIVETYTAANPNVKIEFETQQWTPLFTKFLAEASTGNAPQILAMRPMDMVQFIDMDLLRDDFAGTLGIDAASYSEAAWNGTFYNDKQYAIPLDQHMHGVYYNKDLFEKAGIEKAPATGEEFVETARKLTIDANGKNATEDGFDKDNIVQYGLGFNMNHHVGFQMSALIKQQGETPFTSDMETVPFTDEKAVKALGWIQDLVLKYHVAPVGEKSPVDNFVAGTVAMFIDGPWQMPTLEATDLNWDSTPYPNVFGESAAWGNSHVFTFPAGNTTPEQDKAITDFMAWMAENSGEWAKSGQIPASTSGQEAAASMPGRKAFIESMPTMYMLPASPKSAELFGSSATSPFVVAAQSLLLDGETPENVVKTLRGEMDAILSMP